MFVNQDNSARPDGNYANVISQIAKDGVCPFCEDHLTKYHKRPLQKKKFWWVTDNMYPYKPTKHHRIIIHIGHVEKISDLSAEEWIELKEIIDEESSKREITGGSLGVRFGDTHFTGASVAHLHAHLIQSDPSDPNYDKSKGVLMRVG